MKKLLKTYSPFSRAGVQSAMAYRANFIFFLIGEIFKCFVMYFVWRAVFDSSQSQNFMGFTMEDMTVYVFISFLTGYLSFSDGAFALGEEIVDGSVSMRMIKPCSFDMCFLFQELGNKVINYSIMFVPIVLGVEIYRFVITGAVQFNIISFVLFFVSLQLAYLINFYFNVCYGFLAFFLKNLWGTNLIKDVIVGFLSGSTIPLAFYARCFADSAYISAVCKPFLHTCYDLYEYVLTASNCVFNAFAGILACSFCACFKDDMAFCNEAPLHTGRLIL